MLLKLTNPNPSDSPDLIVLGEASGAEIEDFSSSS
jgi:hypothetical protein